MVKSLSYQQGVAAIEFTIILPLMLLLIFATAEFGRLLYQYNALNQAVRDAGRYLTNYAIPDDNNNVDISLEHGENARNLILYGQVVVGDLRFANLTSGDISFSAVTPPFVTINVSYNWQPIFADTLSILGNNLSLEFPLVVNYTVRAL
jgi:hypothetical protein